MVRLPAPLDLKRLSLRLSAPARIAGARSWAQALARAAVSQVRTEWSSSGLHRALIAYPRPKGQGAAPRDFRPLRPGRGRAIAAGRYVFDGLELEIGPGAEPWNRPSPSRAFAGELHAMAWLPDLLGAGQDAPRTALSLVLGWVQVFGRWNPFAWAPPVLERRVYAMACGLKPMLAMAAPAEAATVLESLAGQARHLLLMGEDPSRAAERAAVASIAGAALAGKAGEGLLAAGLKRLEPALKHAVLPDGGHVSRSPEAGMELLLDLLTLDDALVQLGKAPPEALARAIDRLTAALRFFTLADGALPAMQGGEAGDPQRVAAARAHDDAAEGALAAPPSPSLPHARYEMLAGRALQVIVDAGAPAAGADSRAACAHPLAMEVLAGRARLITNSAWSARAPGVQALRLTPAGSTATIADASAGYPISGMRARLLGPRLEGGARVVDSRRHDSAGGVWLELSHDGWLEAFGLIHERRLFLDAADDELRGEDSVGPPPGAAASSRRRPTFLTVRFQLHATVKASAALDHKSVLLQTPASGGWRLRSDAPETFIEPSAHLVEGRPQKASQVVLRVLVRRDNTARVRWKLTPADS
jgi:uncharacterized heparinase superfamily protein